MAGSARQSGTNDGMGSAARFVYPSGVAVDSADNDYVADTWNYTVRKVTSRGIVTTVAGVAGQAGYFTAGFNLPRGVAVDSAGNVYVADSENETITKGTLLPLFDTRNQGLMVFNGSFHARLIGPFGSDVVVEASSNFQAWRPIQTNVLPPGGLSLSVPLFTNQYQFFRARTTSAATETPTRP